MALPVVDDGFRLSIHRVVLASRRFGPSVWFRWSWHSGGERIGWINIAVTLGGASTGALHLRYHCNDTPFEHRYCLVAAPCRFGGQRWFAICPETGRKASKLYCLAGAGFHARHRYRRVAYRTQRAPSAIDRLLLRRNRILCQKLKGDDPSFVSKPKWMRWATYDRWMCELEKAEVILDQHSAFLLARIEAIASEQTSQKKKADRSPP